LIDFRQSTVVKIDPPLYAHSPTDAVMPVTADLLAATYLAPRISDWDISAALAAPDTPCAESLHIAPVETLITIERALHAVMSATPGLDPAALLPEQLPASRSRQHLSALRNVWEFTGTLPSDLAVVRHVLSCDATRALAPLPLLDLGDEPFSNTAEKALAAQLRTNHGKAAPASRDAWLHRQPQGAEHGALAHIQRNFLAGGPTVARDATLGRGASR
jgi:hypothetical protein